MRVSAFTYRWTQILGEDETDSKLNLQKIWEPVGVWAEFAAEFSAAQQEKLTKLLAISKRVVYRE